MERIINIQERIRALVEHGDGSMPWAFGFDPVGGTCEALVIWRSLSLVEKLLISKFCPFRPQRNELIRQLKELSVSKEVICQLSGLRLSQIKHIGKSQRTKE